VAIGRRTARRQAVFLLYQQDLLGLTPEAAMGRGATADALDPYTLSLVSGVGTHARDIDDLLSANLSGWTLDRLGILERSILRLGAYEMLWESQIPHAVVIDEAVELAKRFCSDEAGALVNGVLGALSGGLLEHEAGDRG
jgi:N utilization substance protein B